MIIDESTEFGARVAAHLRNEIVVWMTVVAPKSGPLPMPVWFLWEGGETVRMFSRDGARIRNLEANPLVSLNFDGDGGGGDIVVLERPRDGRARRAEDARGRRLRAEVRRAHRADRAHARVVRRRLLGAGAD